MGKAKSESVSTNLQPPREKGISRGRHYYRQLKMMGSMALILIYYYIVVFDSHVARDKFEEYSFITSFTKARRARDELNYLYQFSIGLTYLSGLGLIIRPFVCLGGFNFIVNSFYHLFLLVYPFIKHIEHSYDKDATDHAMDYMRREANREKDVHWRLLACAALVFISFHWSFAQGWRRD